jgi:LmbE family N-acetylglucosaminyl deacetylase
MRKHIHWARRHVRSGPRRVCTVVLSPHLDDAVLSLGATLHRDARRAWDVTVLTVLAGDPASGEPASRWDAQAGFSTAGEAAAARRTEDLRACTMLGVRPVWLPFVDGSYGRLIEEEQVWRSVARHLAAADRVLLPGFPLEHQDHAWLTRLALMRIAPGPLVGLYVEQPYALRKRPRITPAVRDLLDGVPRWTVVRAAVRDRAAKLRACRAYRSQRPLLARSDPLVLTRIALSDARRGGEWVAWLGPTTPGVPGVSGPFRWRPHASQNWIRA